MDLIERARKYLQSCPPAISGQGGHNQTYTVAVAMVNGFGLCESDAMILMEEYNATCQPPWSEAELSHKVKTAISTPHDKKRGHLAGPGTHQNGSSNTKTTPKSGSKPAKAGRTYNVSADGELPQPIADGTRAFLRAAFREGEGVRIQIGRNAEDGREIPKDGGVTLSREEWLRKLDECQGDPNGILSSAANNGIFCAINPYKLGCTKDADVTAYRHALIEFDNISKPEQFQLYAQSSIPCTVIADSGGKSIHAWVKVDARDRKEYDERVKILYDHFSTYKPDEKNKNVGRFSRLPGCVRKDKRQELLAVNVGAASFSEWLATQETEGIGRRLDLKDLLTFNPETDPNNLLGARWLCRGGKAFLIAQSGVGKSTLIMQMAFCFALGRSLWGVAPVRPLRVMIVQEENDDGDMSEMFQGMLAGMGFTKSVEDSVEIFRQLEERVILITEESRSGHEFCDVLRRRIDLHKPDIVIGDPFLSFYGDDVNNQKAVTQFLRNWMNPLIKATGVCMLWVHHTGKPSSDPKSKKGWTSSDFSYIGAGSAELTNWARAVMYLHAIDEQSFRLLFAKRGQRARAMDMKGSKTREIFLRYSTTGIFWEQIEKPVNEEEAKAASMVKTEAGAVKFDVTGFLESIEGQYLKVTQVFHKCQDFASVTQKQFYGDEKKSGLWVTLQNRMYEDKESKTWTYSKNPQPSEEWG